MFIGGGILVLLLVAEAVLRAAWGFGKMPLYAASDEWEYMTLPNQSGTRLGNKFCFNSYGMRCEEVDSTRKHVLGLGDSVINGGVQTEQDSLATSLFSAETGVQMLNISAGSWGPDNCAAFLRHYGLFDARAMFLVVGSHDAHDNMSFQPVVGVSESYPDRQYCCAIVEVACRYIWPRYLRKLFRHHEEKKVLDPDQQVLAGVGKQQPNGKTATGAGIDKNDGRGFNPGFGELKLMADSAGIPLVMFLHADEEECKAGKYNAQGWEIIRWCEAHRVRLVKDLDCGFTADDLRDGIHLNVHGQRKLANVMEKEIFKGKKVKR